MPLEVEFLSEEYLHLYVDGKLSPAQENEIEQFLAENPEYMHLVKIMKRHVEGLKSLYEVEKSDPVFAEVEAWTSARHNKI